MSRNKTEHELLGYLLDALDPEERASVEARLAAEPPLRRSLEVLRSGLAPLRADGEHYVPPLRLAARTQHFVERTSHGAPVHAEPVGGGLTWRWSDLMVAAAVLAVASMLFLPSVAKSRFDQQVAYCSENLHQIGTALWQYSQQHGDYFPYVPSQGNYAAAGVFGPTLLDGGYLDRPQSLLCPTSPQAQAGAFHQVQLVDLQKAHGEALTNLQRRMGGSYGYALGYEKNGRYFGNRNRARSKFALVADAPSMRDAGKLSVNHNRRGQNVLYEDGRVQFMRSCTAAGCQDDIYHNDVGLVGAGQHANDAVVAPSAAPPLQLWRVRWYLIVDPSTIHRIPSAPLSNRSPAVMPELFDIDERE